MNTDTAITMLLAMGVAAVVSFLSTPMVKSLAYKAVSYTHLDVYKRQ